MNAPASPGLPTSTLLGVRFHRVDRRGLLDFVAQRSRQGGGVVANLNIHAMNLAWRDARYRQILNTADLVFIDGAGVMLGARVAGVATGERLTPADWIEDLLRICSTEQFGVYWLGDTDEVGSAFERKARAAFPALQFAGRHHGFFDHFGAEGEAVAEKIRQSGARVILVGMSMPLQEKWIARHQGALGETLCLAVGGLARIYTGNIRRGPRWMTDHGLEWLYRMAMQPRYTWRRYLLGNPLFLARVLLVRFRLLRPPHGG